MEVSPRSLASSEVALFDCESALSLLNLECFSTLYVRLHVCLNVFGPCRGYLCAVGGSQAGVIKGGLTAFGRKVVSRMKALDMVVDLAHSSDRLIEGMYSFLFFSNRASRDGCPVIVFLTLVTLASIDINIFSGRVIPCHPFLNENLDRRHNMNIIHNAHYYR